MNESPTLAPPASPTGSEREELLLAHLPEVHYIARRIHERLPAQVPFEDLVHAGVLGLIDAVDKFDFRRQVQLKSYAKFRIRGAILDSLRAADWSPRRLRQQARKLETAVRELGVQLGRSPSELELAARLGLELAQLQQLLGELHGLDLGSLQAEHGEEAALEGSGALEVPASPEEDPFLRCLQSEMRSFLSAALESLEEKERQVVALYYLEELNMKEVGAVLGIGESRVSQLHALAMVRLRARLQELLQSRAAGEHDASAPQS